MDAGMKLETNIQVKRKKSTSVSLLGNTGDHVAFPVKFPLSLSCLISPALRIDINPNCKSFLAFLD